MLLKLVWCMLSARRIIGPVFYAEAVNSHICVKADVAEVFCTFNRILQLCILPYIPCKPSTVCSVKEL
jgi:hypothetical protein